MFGEFVEFVDDDAVDQTEVGRARDGRFVAEETKKGVKKFTAEFRD